MPGRALPQTRIFENLIQNMPARAARKNFVKICRSAQNLRPTSCASHSHIAHAPSRRPTRSTKYSCTVFVRPHVPMPFAIICHPIGRPIQAGPHRRSPYKRELHTHTTHHTHTPPQPLAVAAVAIAALTANAVAGLFAAAFIAARDLLSSKILAKFADPVQNLPIKICREINQNPYLGQTPRLGQSVNNHSRANGC